MNIKEILNTSVLNKMDINPKELKVYRHYKGNYYIKLKELDNKTEDRIDILYVSVEGNKLYTRSKLDFESTVITKNGAMSRFLEITDDKIPQKLYKKPKIDSGSTRIDD